MNAIFNKVVMWQNETFPHSTAESKIHHLREEVEELLEAIEIQDANVRLEFADCFMLLFGAAYKQGMVMEDIESAIWEKYHINKKRKAATKSTSMIFWMKSTEGNEKE